MIQDFLSLGGLEIANSARLATYAETVGTPLTEFDGCGCSTLTAAVLGDAEYTTPDADAAPWYDPAVPESKDFAGLLVLSVDGIDDHPVNRAVTGAVTGGAALGPRRVQARTITLTGILLGATCCAVEYGLRWLAQALEGCGNRCGDCPSAGCGGADLVMYNCCPSETETPAQFAAQHRRTMRRVALTSGPTVTARVGDGCTGTGGCQIGADIITVEIVLTAGTPWAWSDPMPVLDVAPPTTADADDCAIRWCVHPEDGPATACETECRNAPCPDMSQVCTDPSCSTPTPPTAPPPATCYCLPVAAERTCYSLDRSGRAAWFPDAPIITVSAGASDLRDLTIYLYERDAANAGLDCEDLADAERCAPHSIYTIGFVPAGGLVTLDGQIGRATATCAGVTGTAPSAWGQDGAPPSWSLLSCPAFCICLETNSMFLPAADAHVSISLSGQGY